MAEQTPLVSPIAAMLTNTPWKPSARAEVIARRTYCRPTDDGGFETWAEVVDRVIMHQRWLWERAKGDKPLDGTEIDELEELRELILTRKASLSGRTLWLGGTDVAKKREASQFNCSFLKVETVHDVVDTFWLLLQGCGVGFEPVTGNLNGFTKSAKVEIVRSERHRLVQQKGVDRNQESWEDNGETWRLTVGDSAEAWAKAVGKIMAQKRPFSKIIIDFSQVRPAGYRLRGYGWISSGDEMLAKAVPAICEIMSRRAGKLLTRIDILDICNWLGTTLSSRRSAQIAVVPYGDPEWREFAMAKRDHWSNGNEQRSQSNNSLVFYQHPGREALAELFQMMQDAGGSEPGLLNAEAAKKRAPWYSGANPCAEILLPNKGFCNLVEVNLARFNGNYAALVRAIIIMGRANYRQTCVNLDDGVLQRAWHENQEFLRLTGVGVTGVVRWDLKDSEEAWLDLNLQAHNGVHSMADELGMPRSKAVTTIKPSGTLSKIMDTTEGAHKPLGRYIFNNVRFSKHDPYLDVLHAANYRSFEDPYNADSIIVTFPVDNGPAGWDIVDGREVNLEPAVAQLDRYKLLMDNYVDHNCSVTISYSPEEVPAIVDWLNENWDDYVGVSFLYRTDPTKTAADLGYPYLPQEVVTQEAFNEYADTLKPLKHGRKGVKHKDHEEDLEIDAGEECATGACPIR
jgi:adenosylcobalamin-dependent ribonucleoside-triphosphate reductase